MRGGRSFEGRGGLGLIKSERGGCGKGGAAQSARGNYKSYPVSRTTSKERAERSRGWGWGGESF